ncbi:MAG: hypothetical protein FJ211_07230 [Ignavibacteria bacterium]|nr:hypothetical protein [Ignavibacteria bacterium]
MNATIVCTLFSSISFFLYVVMYFVTDNLQNDFKRFELEQFGLLVIFLELLGALGLMIGLKYNPLLTISSLGLALLMLCGFIVRIYFGDSIWISLPALFYMLLNGYICYLSLR